MSHPLPEFTQTDVALLISAVEEALERLRDANERRGGDDRELVEYGTRYSLLLQKLQALAPGGPPGGSGYNR